MFSGRFVAVLALAALLSPLVPVSAFVGHADAMDMACCAADHCRMPALSAPCCTHTTTANATPPVASTTIAAPAAAAVGHWDAFALDLLTGASHWRVRALADTIRARPPDPPHLLYGVFLI